MALTTARSDSATEVPETRAEAPWVVARPAGWLNLLAVAGVFFLCYQAWTWIAWLHGHPHQLTQFRDTDDFSWYLAIAYQLAACTALLVILGVVIRDCIRQRTLTFDAMFCIAGLFTYWLDATANVLQPVFFYSSQWINLNDWTGYMPGMINPDASRMPESFLFTLPIYAGGLLVFVKLTCWFMGRCRHRWPNLSAAGLIGVALAVGLLIDIAIELPMFAFNLWAYPGAPDMPGFPGLSGAHNYPIAEMLIGMGIWAPMALMYYYRDNTGKTFIERGLTHRSTRRRMLVTQLRLVGFFNIVMICLASNYWILGLHSHPYPQHMKPYIVNNACDAPGYSGTRYGPCPGSPGYRMPLPGDLTGPGPVD